MPLHLPRTCGCVTLLILSVVLRMFHRPSCSLQLNDYQYTDDNQDENGAIPSGPNGSGVGIITSVLCILATILWFLRAVSAPRCFMRQQRARGLYPALPCAELLPWCCRIEDRGAAV